MSNMNYKERNHSMLIETLVTAKRPCTKTSMNSPRPISVNFQSTCSLCANDLAVFESQEQELKAQYLKYKYEQKRYSVS